MLLLLSLTSGEESTVLDEFGKVGEKGPFEISLLPCILEIILLAVGDVLINVLSRLLYFILFSTTPFCLPSMVNIASLIFVATYKLYGLTWVYATKVTWINGVII